MKQLYVVIKDIIESTEEAWELSPTSYNALKSLPGYSFVDMDDAKVLVLNKEQILVFPGDLVYAGVDFNDENVRLHCCALIKSIEQKEDTPEVDALARYLCETCLLMSESRRHLANHILTVKCVGSRDEKEDD
ncbi:hypothetical protein F442_00271 [Phytophthora nicotianae P10297]|uniref:Uncharacterized protein n=1 Tax=Phytophthora nicotianae P10297 TaxID=1317064 RepID=W3A6C8_PHYNI|nr:hypothetical protein F442_00271 [Phytophthora nicotianae P10297]